MSFSLDLGQNTVSTANPGLSPLLLFTFKVVDRVEISMTVLAPHVVHRVFGHVSFAGSSASSKNSSIASEESPEASSSPIQGFFWKTLENNNNKNIIRKQCTNIQMLKLGMTVFQTMILFSTFVYKGLKTFSIEKPDGLYQICTNNLRRESFGEVQCKQKVLVCCDYPRPILHGIFELHEKSESFVHEDDVELSHFPVCRGILI
jgi:hypothetical protein